mmetsp:Transcript_7766/g.15206  ORF Transcript_7766/g.15206 Transcript_7766/m.15206 type:complete len:93 (-) Transcript_7766:776-1054(-)
MSRRDTVLVAAIHVGTRHKQHSDNIDVAMHDCLMKRSPSPVAETVHIRSHLEQDPHPVNLATARLQAECHACSLIAALGLDKLWSVDIDWLG